jgi:hypothetical protein
MKVSLKMDCLRGRAVEFLAEELSPMECDRLIAGVEQLVGDIPGLGACLKLQ